MLNQALTNKIVSYQNSNIPINIYYKNKQIKKVFELEHIRPPTKQMKYIFDNEFEELLKKTKNL